MRLVWGLVAALGLLVGAGLAGGRIAPPEQVTRPVAPHETVLIRGTAQPAPAIESAPPTPTRLPPAVAVPGTAEESRPGAARDVPSAAQVRPEASSAPVAVATGARPQVARPAATAAGGTQRDVARPTAEPPKPGVPWVSAATPTPCVLEPPPRHLDAAAPAPKK